MKKPNTHSSGIATVTLIGYLAIAGVVSWIVAPKVKPLLLKNEAKQVQKVDAKIDAQEDKVDEIKKEVILDAHKDLKGAIAAIDKIPQSPAQELAKDFANSADAKLTKVDGGVDPAQIIYMQKLVDRLLSDNKEIQVQAQKEKEALTKTSQELINKLNKSELELAKLNTEKEGLVIKLEQGFAREKELADKYRTLQMFGYGLIVLIVLGVAFTIYQRITHINLLGNLGTAFDNILTKPQSNLEDELAKALSPKQLAQLNDKRNI